MSQGRNTLTSFAPSAAAASMRSMIGLRSRQGAKPLAGTLVLDVSALSVSAVWPFQGAKPSAMALPAAKLSTNAKMILFRSTVLAKGVK